MTRSGARHTKPITIEWRDKHFIEKYLKKRKIPNNK